MEKKFHISFSMNTPLGFETYGTFDLGSGSEQAAMIFKQLKGTKELAEKSILHMDFTEVGDGLPIPIEMLHCTLDDIAYNSRVITRELFKKNLEAMKI